MWKIYMWTHISKKKKNLKYVVFPGTTTFNSAFLSCPHRSVSRELPLCRVPRIRLRHRHRRSWTQQPARLDDTDGVRQLPSPLKQISHRVFVQSWHGSGESNRILLLSPIQDLPTQRNRTIKSSSSAGPPPTECSTSCATGFPNTRRFVWLASLPACRFFPRQPVLERFIIHNRDTTFF